MGRNTGRKQQQQFMDMVMDLTEALVEKVERAEREREERVEADMEQAGVLLDKCTNGTVTEIRATHNGLVCRFSLATPSSGLQYLYLINTEVQSRDPVIFGPDWYVVIRDTMIDAAKEEGSDEDRSFRAVSISEVMPEIAGIPLVLHSVRKQRAVADDIPIYSVHLLFSLDGPATDIESCNALEVGFYPFTPYPSIAMYARTRTELGKRIKAADEERRKAQEATVNAMRIGMFQQGIDKIQ